MKICVSIGEATATEVFKRLDSAADADLFEIRFDHLPVAERMLLVDSMSAKDLRSKLIATLRPVAQGGRAETTREERIAFFRDLEGYFAFDLEEDIAHIDANASKKIVSFHHHCGVPEEIAEIFERLTSFDPDIVKIACTVVDAADALPLWKLFDRAKEKGIGIVPIAMGEAGKWTRILGPAYGAPIAYAAIDNGAATAAGQFSIAELTGRYRLKEITPETAVFGILGDPVSASLSPVMQNTAFAANGEDAIFVPFQVTDIETFFSRMIRPETREVDINFGGFAVTMPHKLAVMRLLDELDDAARMIGAVNTVQFADGKLIGRNTDAAGFLAPLSSRFGDIAGMRFAVIGAGGAARACVFALKSSGADVTVFARDIRKASEDLERFDVKINRSDETMAFDGFEIVVNATPVGMLGEKLLSPERLKGVRCVYDLITKDTPLLAAARAAGIEAISGREMLLEQGIMQFEIWTNRTAPRAAMQGALDEEGKWESKR